MTADALTGSIAAWHSACRDAISLLRSLDADDWEKPTDLAGWNVRYCAAHLAHLESSLAGNDQPQAEVPEDLPHVQGLMGKFTEEGPLARASWSTEQIIDELDQSMAKRAADLENNPPDPTALASGFAGLIGWSWQTLLSNRGVDVWMHEQDIRRATGNPGNLDTLGAQHVAGVFTASFPFVVGKRAKAPTGATVVLQTTGAQELTIGAAVQDGRGTPMLVVPDDPTTRITLDFEDFIILSGGRRTAEGMDITIEGDRTIGEAVVANLAVTP